jgi:hypothetical protein
MKRGLGWILAWLAVVCLLLSLGLEASVNHERYVAWERSVGRWREFVSFLSSRILRATSTQFIRSRAGPLESFLPPGVLLRADDVGPVGPPWLDYRGPPGACGRPRVSSKAAGHAGSSKQGIEHASSRNSCRQWPKFETRSFSTGFS